MELISLLTVRSLFLHMKYRLYTYHVRSAFLYDSEMWPVEDDNIKILKYTKKSIVRWLCSSTVRDDLTNEE